MTTLDATKGRKAVCRRCHVVMDDAEPFGKYGEFWHPLLARDGKTPRRCVNVGKCFHLDDPKEVEPFMRKAERRRNKRNGVRP